jgi:hypothetical protein
MSMAWILALAAVFIAGLIWFNWRSTVRVPCELDLERTHDHFHAHVELMGVLVEAGDAVQIEDAPDSLEYGEIRRIESRAVVKRASWLRRKWTRLVGSLEFYELYDVGFE